MSVHFQQKRIGALIRRVPGICDHAAANLLAAFEGFPLIPIPIGDTAQEVQLQPPPLAAEAMSPDYRQRLSVSSIAAVLGVGGLT